jgi:hypothetical protein
MSVEAVTFYRATCDGCAEPVGCDDDYAAWSDVSGALAAADSAVVIRHEDNPAASLVICDSCGIEYLKTIEELSGLEAAETELRNLEQAVDVAVERFELWATARRMELRSLEAAHATAVDRLELWLAARRADLPS